MANQYTGDRTSAQLPGSVPNDGVSPIGVLPTDGDDLNASSVLQVLKEALDFIDYCTHRFQDFMGVRAYDASRTYTAGMMCLDEDGMTYRVKAGQSSTNIRPANDGTKWERWGYSATELAAAFVSSGGATVRNLTFPGGIRLTIETLASNQLPTENSPSFAFSFATAFPTNCFGILFQPSSYSNSHNAGCPQVLVGSVTRTGCTLLRPDTDATGEVSSGYLFAIGN